MEDNGGGLIGLLFGGVMMMIWLVVVVAFVAAMWKIFVKAGQPGWAAIVPIYNLIVMLQIVGRPLWWIVLFLIPLVNFVAIVMINMDLARSFGKDANMALICTLLSFCIPALPLLYFFGLLGFGDAQYQGPAAATATL
jgi:uncharacterized membrane protein YoaK (UPF0700 family)